MNTSLIKLLGASLLAVTFSGVARAIPLTSVSASLASLTDQDGGSLTIGDKTFSDFGFLATAEAGSFISFTPANINVVASYSGGVYYLTWNGNMTWGGSGVGLLSGDLLLTYTVAASAGKIDYIDQSYTGSGQGFGAFPFLAIDETVKTGSTILANSHLQLGDLSDDPLFPGTVEGSSSTVVGDNLYLSTPQSKVSVTKDINFSAIALGGGAVITLSQVEQSFHQTSNVPDGGTTALLLGAGLLGIGGLARRKRAKA